MYILWQIYVINKKIFEKKTNAYNLHVATINFYFYLLRELLLNYCLLILFFLNTTNVSIMLESKVFRLISFYISQLAQLRG